MAVYPSWLFFLFCFSKGIVHMTQQSTGSSPQNPNKSNASLTSSDKKTQDNLQDNLQHNLQHKSGGSRAGRILFGLPVIAILIVIDQITKVIAVNALGSGRRIPLIEGVLEFTYVQNRGAAFGILQNALPFFVIITLAALAVICYVLVRVPADRHFLPIRLCLCFIAAGAVGNFIDRLFLSYVRDFIYFCLIDFPVFNVADIYITCATAILILLMLLYYRDEEELSFLS